MSKTYVGTAKAITTKHGGLLKIGLRADDLALLQKHINNGWVNLAVGKRQNVSESGLTHSIWIDDWKPEQSQQAVPNSSAQNPVPPVKTESDGFDDFDDDFPY